ncbi:hypothetical protein ABZ656_44745 [Streptomyces sp. NPDC007095]|uniref:hypothetical protein n=1 Tax=Streptomyces sp. NPDC007095 TaxID=3154482 RepID=UPI0033C6ABF3
MLSKDDDDLSGGVADAGLANDVRGVGEWDFRIDTHTQLTGGWLAAHVVLDGGLPGISRRGSPSV